MKIVLATKTVPFPLTNGSAIRNFQLLRWLSERHEITLVTFVRSEEERVGIEELKRFCRTIVAIDERRTLWRKLRDVVRSIGTGVPYTICAHDSVRFRSALKTAAQNSDLIQLQELYLTASLPAVVAPVILDAHNVEATILERMAAVEPKSFRRWIYRSQAAAMDRYEVRAMTRFAAVIALSEPECERFRALHARVLLAPNGVEQRQALPARAGKSTTLVFVGTLEYAPNRDAVEHFITAILPHIEQRIPDVELRIIGATPAWTGQFAGRRGVRFLGRVKELGVEFDRAALMVVPLRAGGGTRLKILDAFTAGLPVVSTTIGAEGLGVTDGNQLLLRDRPEEFADAVVELLEAKSRGEALAASAFAWSQQTLCWKGIVESLEPLYTELTSRSAA